MWNPVLCCYHASTTLQAITAYWRGIQWRPGTCSDMVLTWPRNIVTSLRPIECNTTSVLGSDIKSNQRIHWCNLNSISCICVATRNSRNANSICGRFDTSLLYISVHIHLVSTCTYSCDIAKWRSGRYLWLVQLILASMSSDTYSCEINAIKILNVELQN